MHVFTKGHFVTSLLYHKGGPVITMTRASFGNGWSIIGLRAIRRYSAPGLSTVALPTGVKKEQTKNSQ